MKNDDNIGEVKSKTWNKNTVLNTTLSLLYIQNVIYKKQEKAILLNIYKTTFFYFFNSNMKDYTNGIHIENKEIMPLERSTRNKG